MERKNHHRMVVCWAAGCACFTLCIASLGQVVQPLGTFPRANGQPRQATQASVSQHANQSLSAPFAAPAAPPSLLDKPARPAKIDLAAGHLAIQADNSSLSDILHQVTTASGMTVEGLGQDQRIFGSYGPGDPQEVLLGLLHGSGYNVVMVGQTATGAPRQLTLTPRSAGVVANNGPSRPQQVNQDEDNDDEVQAQPAPEPPPPPATPPETAPQNGVRTPQQMLQELQQMRQRQQQQQQPQQEPQPQ